MRRKNANLILLLLVLFIGLTCLPHRPAFPQEEKKAGPYIPLDKQTSLSLYVNAVEAYAMWQKDPANIKILDVRLPEEYIFIGHAPMAYNIPVKFMTYKWNPNKNDYIMEDNPDFLAEVQNRFKVTDTILIMCRLGTRSSLAVNKLAQAGFKNVYNIVDGFEGDAVKDPDSYFDGKRLKNGWKNSGAPWTYILDPKLVYLPKQVKSPSGPP